MFHKRTPYASFYGTKSPVKALSPLQIRLTFHLLLLLLLLQSASSLLQDLGRRAVLHPLMAVKRS